MQNFLYTSDVFKGSRYGEGHPLDMDRVWPSVELVQMMGWIEEKQIVKHGPATIEELIKFHDLDYILALKKAEEKLEELEDEYYDENETLRTQINISTGTSKGNPVNIAGGEKNRATLPVRETGPSMKQSKPVMNTHQRKRIKFGEWYAKSKNKEKHQEKEKTLLIHGHIQNKRGQEAQRNHYTSRC